MLGETGEFGMDEREASAVSLDQRLASGNRSRIAIERNDIGARNQNGRRVSTSTERTIEDNLTRPGIERPQNFGKKNRNVANRSASGFRRTSARIRHHSVSPSYRADSPRSLRPSLAAACAA